MTWTLLPAGVELDELVHILNSHMIEQTILRDRQRPKLSYTFYYDNVPADAGETALEHTGGVVKDIVGAFGAQILGFSVQSDSALTAGTVTVTPTLGSTKIDTGLDLTTDVQEGLQYLEPDKIGTYFWDGTTLAKLGCVLESTGVAPTTAAIQVTLFLELTGEDTIG
jgi:hypothetical protein